MILLLTLPLLVPVYYALRYLLELVPNSSAAVASKRCVFITGCDSGFGRLLALKLARNGIPALAGCLTQQGVNELVKESKTLPVPVEALQLDVTSDESVNHAAKWVSERLTEGRVLWTLVNNAGVFSVYGPDAWSDMHDYKHSLEVNLLGLIRTTHAFVPLLKRSKGRVVSTSSVAGRVSVPCGAPYAVAKYGVEAYMDAIRLELEPFGVSCHILEPGIFKTGLINKDAMNRRVDETWQRLPAQLREEYGEQYKNRFVENWNEHMLKNSSPQVSWVVDSYYHAITGRFPRLRYRCGWDSIFFYIPFSFLPTWLGDFIFVHFLTKRNNMPLPAVLDGKEGMGGGMKETAKGKRD